jgi:pimeloyl-CoA dehydrogenase small subunit
MDFDFTAEQRMLKDSVDRLVAERYDFEQRTRYLASADGWSREMWHLYAEMGLLGLPFAEADGGVGGGPVDTMIVMEAIGRGLVLEPYFATVILAGGCLRIGANPTQRASLIPAISAGELLVSLAHSESQSRYELANVRTTARREGKQWILNGSKRFVINGDKADKLIVSARVRGEQRDRDGLALFLVDAQASGVTRRGYLTQDRLRAADVQLSNVRAHDAELIGEAGNAMPIIERTVDEALAAVCAEAVGVMAKAHELTVDYLKTRKQFGVSIGSFQALQHRAVDMLVMIEQARSMALFATMMADEPDPIERGKAMSAAKIQIGKSARYVGEQAVQLHGGIGVTEECHAGHYFRRLTMLEQLLGDTDHHLAALARQGGLFA